MLQNITAITVLSLAVNFVWLFLLLIRYRVDAAPWVTWLVSALLVVPLVGSLMTDLLSK